MSPAYVTPQEKIVIRHLCAGKSAQEAADAMCLSIRTINFHTDNIYKKLKITNRIELFIWAIEQGVVAAPARKPQGASL